MHLNVKYLFKYLYKTVKHSKCLLSLLSRRIVEWLIKCYDKVLEKSFGLIDLNI